MALTTSEINAGLDDVSQRVAAERVRLKQAKVSITSAKTTLTAMATQYATLVSDINALPADEAFADYAKDLKNKLVAEFQALKSVATDAETAVANILP